MKNNWTAISARTSLLVLLSLIISSLHFYLSPWRSLLMIPCYLGLPLSLLLDIEDEDRNIENSLKTAFFAILLGTFLALILLQWNLDSRGNYLSTYYKSVITLERTNDWGTIKKDVVKAIEWIIGIIVGFSILGGLVGSSIGFILGDDTEEETADAEKLVLVEEDMVEYLGDEDIVGGLVWTAVGAFIGGIVGAFIGAIGVAISGFFGWVFIGGIVGALTEVFVVAFAGVSIGVSMIGIFGGTIVATTIGIIILSAVGDIGVSIGKVIQVALIVLVLPFLGFGLWGRILRIIRESVILSIIVSIVMAVMIGFGFHKSGVPFYALGIVDENCMLKPSLPYIGTPIGLALLSAIILGEISWLCRARGNYILRMISLIILGACVLTLHWR